MTTKNLLAVSLCTSLAFVASQTAQAAVWNGDGVGNEYSTADNWDDDAVPNGGANSTQDINGAFTVERSVDSTAGRTFLKGGAVLNVTGGTHNDSRSGANIFNFVGDNGSGTVNQSGGEYSIGHGLRLGVGNTANTLDGTYNLTGGDLIIYRGSNSKSNGSNPGGRPSMEIGDTAGSGLFEISGGSLETRAGVHIAQTGVFSVVGSDATAIDLGTNGSGDSAWIQQAGGTLKFAIDAGGVTSIFVDDDDATDDAASGAIGSGDPFAQFDLGSLLDLSFDGIAPVAGTWTLMELENSGITNNGLALTGATDSNWSFAIDNSGTNGLLTATYVVPEPGSLALLGLGGLMIARRRRDA